MVCLFIAEGTIDVGIVKRFTALGLCFNNMCPTFQLFTGNSNTYIAELREINPPIIARVVRIVPQSSYPRTICLRLELYGCQWRGELLSSCQICLCMVS